MHPYAILVVEDEPALRKLVATFLREEGYAVHEAATGQEALALLEHDLPDVLLLDTSLPDMRDEEVVAYVRAQGIPSKILVMTAAREVRQVARRLHADGYVAKPFSLLQVLHALRRVRPRAA
jgi:two-component system KDP operon response regulator KdpE